MDQKLHFKNWQHMQLSKREFKANIYSDQTVYYCFQESTMLFEFIIIQDLPLINPLIESLFDVAIPRSHTQYYYK